MPVDGSVVRIPATLDDCKEEDHNIYVCLRNIIYL